MHNSNSNLVAHDVAKEILSWVGLDLISCINLQTLWAGYGHVCAIKARPAGGLDSAKPLEETHLILKLISPPAGPQDEGYLRKILSYQVEQYFYDNIAPTLDGLPLAKCLATTSGMPDKAQEAGLLRLNATLMTDLRLKYPVAGGKRAFLTPQQVDSALRWLAEFHRRHWKGGQLPRSQLILPPLEEAKLRQTTQKKERNGLWLNGGYTYLATRRSEYSSLLKDKESEWSSLFCCPDRDSGMSIAEMASTFLTPCGRAVETYLHGDVKSENMYSTEDGSEVAFFDFQYVGLGLGVCDLAKLFTCSVPLEMLVDGCEEHDQQLTISDGERALLEQYRKYVLVDNKHAPAPNYELEEFQRHWEVALVDWCRFQASWGFWGNTRWLQARVRNILNDDRFKTWLRTEVTMTKQERMTQGS